MGGILQQDIVAMTIDEAIHYAGADVMAARAAHADCTNADVWRVSMKAVVYGCKEIPTVVAVPAPAPAPEQTAALTHNATAPTPTTATPASVAATPAAAAAANTQQSPPNAAK